MPRKGRATEQVVQAIERLFAVNQDVKIESPAFIRDKRSGQRREFDVLISASAGRHTLTTAIEVKDRKRPVGAADLEAFITKCRDSHVAKMAIVATGGYTAPALRKAESYNVDCILLSEINSKASSLLPLMVEVVQNDAKCELVVQFEGNGQSVIADWTAIRIRVGDKEWGSPALVDTSRSF